MREAEDGVPDLVLAHCRDCLLNILFRTGSVELDYLHDFVNVHETGAH